MTSVRAGVRPATLRPWRAALANEEGCLPHLSWVWRPVPLRDDRGVVTVRVGFLLRVPIDGFCDSSGPVRRGDGRSVCTVYKAAHL